MASVVVAQLLFLEAENPKKEIAMYINSPGGVVTAGPLDLRHDAVHPLAGLDAVRRARRPRWARCCSPPARQGSASPCLNARLMVHQPSGGFQGQATDILIHAEEIEA